MSSKEYILRLLDTLQEMWPLAPGLRILVNANMVDDRLIDILIQTIETSIETTKDQTQKATFEKAKTFLQTLKDKEIIDRQQDQKDIIQLETMLQDI